MRMLAIVAILACCLGNAGTAAGTTLREALLQAYLGNTDLAAQRAALTAVETQVAQARAGYLPTITGSLQQQSTNGTSDSAFTFPNTPGQNLSDYERLIESQDANTTTATLTLKQNLYNGGGTMAAMDRARNNVLAGRAQLSSVEQSVLLRAATAYINTWRDRAVLAETIANLKGLESQLAAAQRRYELGKVARTDVVQAEGRVAGAMADVDGARATLADSEADYEKTMGGPPGPLAPPTQVEGLPGSLDSAYSQMAANPDTIKARFDVASARAQVDATFADYLPSLDLQGQLNYQNDPNPTMNSMQTAQVGVTLTVPLFQGGSVAARVSEARATERQRAQDLESQMRQVRRDVRSAWDALRSAQRRVGSYQREERANRQALKGVEQEAYLGQRTTLDILNAQQAVNQSVINRVRAEADLFGTGYRLKSTIGQLTAAELGLPVPSKSERADRLSRLMGLDAPEKAGK